MGRVDTERVQVNNVGLVRISGAIRWLVAGAMVLSVLAGVSRPTSAQPDHKLRVVATNSILGNIVKMVAAADCDCVEVVTLVPVGGDPHTYEPTPKDAEALAGADIIFANGLGLEPWLDDLYASSGSSADRVITTMSIAPLRATGEAGTASGDARAAPQLGTPGAEENDNEDYDPHVWFDVQNVESMVRVIENALMTVDGNRAGEYQKNADAYVAQLQDLDAFVVGQVSTLSPDQRKLVTSHDTFGYFAHRYGFEIVGTALGSVTTEAADPSASQITTLIDQIRASHVRAIFPENTSNPELLEQIASEAGVTVGPPLYTDALGEPGSDGDSYIGMMRYDVTQIVTALHG